MKSNRYWILKCLITVIFSMFQGFSENKYSKIVNACCGIIYKVKKKFEKKCKRKKGKNAFN